MARDGEVIQRQHFCHHGDTICHPECLLGKGTIMRCFQAAQFSLFLPPSYAGHVNLAGAKP